MKIEDLAKMLNEITGAEGDTLMALTFTTSAALAAAVGATEADEYFMKRANEMAARIRAQNAVQ